MLTARTLRFTAAALAVAGIVAGLYAIALGEMRVALLLFVPVAYGEGPLGAASILLLVAALVVWLGAQAKAAGERTVEAGPLLAPRGGRPLEEPPAAEARRAARGGGVVLVGPFPLVWGTDPKTTLWIVIATVVLMLVVVTFIVRPF